MVLLISKLSLFVIGDENEFLPVGDDLRKLMVS